MSYLFLNTLPKSGSVFLREALKNTLNAELLIVGNQYGLVDQLNVRKVISLIEHKNVGIAQGHFAPDPINLQIIEHFDIKLLIHIRDPRQAMLSWIHHIDRLTGGDSRSENVLAVAPKPDNEYFLSNMSQKIDWQIEHYLPALHIWLEKWLLYANKNEERVLISEFLDLHKPEELVARVSSFFGLTFDQAVIPNLNEDINNTHFRQGTHNEFESVFSKRQLSRCVDIAPKDIYERFNWSI